MNYELLRGRYLLLDSNILINYAKFPAQMEQVRAKFDEFETVPVLDELVRFEFIRGAASLEEIQALKKFLLLLFRLKPEEVDKPLFPVTQEIFVTATDIANLYSARLKNLNAPTVDCFLAAQMKKYHERLFLVTSDHKDFPSLLFNRIGIDTVDTGSEIINVCFYSFDMGKFDDAWTKFQAT